MHVTVGTDKPLACLNVVRRLSVDKGQVLRSDIYIVIYRIYVTLLYDSIFNICAKGLVKGYLHRSLLATTKRASFTSRLASHWQHG